MRIELVGGPLDGCYATAPDDTTAVHSRPDDWDAPHESQTEVHRYVMRVDVAGEPVTVEGRVMYDYEGTG